MVEIPSWRLTKQFPTLGQACQWADGASLAMTEEATAQIPELDREGFVMVTVYNRRRIWSDRPGQGTPGA
jgi:hypothetical protein